MSLRSKVLAIVMVVVVLYGGMSLAIQRLIVYPSFVALEKAEAEKDMMRCVEALDREVHHLDAFVHDWAAWDATYEFIVEPNEEYQQGNLIQSAFVDNSINLIFLVNSDRKVVWGQTLDLDTEQHIDLGGFPPDHWPENHPLLLRDFAEDSLADTNIAGILLTERAPMLVSSRPILTSENTGPVRGHLVMGRFLDEPRIAALAEQTRVDLEVLRIADTSLTPAEHEVLGRASSAGFPQLREAGDDTLFVYAAQADILGVPALLLRAQIPKEITARGRAAVWFAMISVSVIGLAILLTLVWLLQRIVVGPIIRLTDHAIRIGQNDDLTTKLPLHTGDEIGTLATEFNRMVDRLADARQRLSEQSYRSGLAEMASGTLHHVRNALTPMLGDLEKLRLEFKKTPLDQIERAKQELADETLSPERRGDLSRFLDLAGNQLVSVARRTQQDLADATGRARDVEKILAEQESVSRAERPLETVQLDRLVEQAAASFPADLREVIEVKASASVAETGSIRTHRVVFAQVVAGLLTNAAESALRSEKPHGCVGIEAAPETIDGVDMVHLQVRDNGDGATREQLNRIFERDHAPEKSTRTLGLHWCANTVNAMGGRIFAESDGLGKGTCLHLLIPRTLSG